MMILDDWDSSNAMIKTWLVNSILLTIVKIIIVYSSILHNKFEILCLQSTHFLEIFTNCKSKKSYDDDHSFDDWESNNAMIKDLIIQLYGIQHSE